MKIMRLRGGLTLSLAIITVLGYCCSTLVTVSVPKMCLFLEYHKKTKALLCMNLFYQILQVITGFDYGFFHSRFKTCIIVKLISLVFCVSISTIALQSVKFSFDDSQELTNNIWFFVYMNKYIANILFLTFTKPDKLFYSFNYNLRLADSKFGIYSSSFNTESKLLCACLISIALRLLLTTVYFLYDLYLPSTILNYVYIISVLGMDVLLVSYALIFSSVNCRLKNLEKVLKKAKSGVITHQLMYKYYVDLLEKHKTAFDPLLIITLCFTIPEVMISIYYVVQGMLYHLISVNGPSTYLEYTTAFLALSMAFAPALSASMLSSTVERIKLLLHHKLLDEFDPVKVNQLVRFIRYVEVRGCRFRVYKVVPLDADLLGMVLGFCATYLIVIIQFTNPHYNN